MLNNFCFHVYAQKSLFIGENGNDFFWTSSSSSSPPDITVHRAGSQLKNQKTPWGISLTLKLVRQVSWRAVSLMPKTS